VWKQINTFQMIKQRSKTKWTAITAKKSFWFS
jgi:hypothetical protein